MRGVASSDRIVDRVPPALSGLAARVQPLMPLIQWRLSPRRERCQARGRVDGTPARQADQQRSKAVDHVAVLVHDTPPVLLPPLDFHEQLVQ